MKLYSQCLCKEKFYRKERKVVSVLSVKTSSFLCVNDEIAHHFEHWIHN